ncbi:MAG: NADH-quinone oxidoreductase subunit H [Candidatus Bathyarchaeota archaeon]|nr:MAG: NADH-quinone oxidoreductase subunit H [Candidatus Bathyarchaeota archaeon]
MAQGAITFLLQIVVFPGFLFLVLAALFYEWLDRKFVARFQNRFGPLHTGPMGLLQPFADLVKLLSKEDIVPLAADKLLFSATPIFLATFPLLALFCVPIVENTALIAFEGDLIFVIFLSTLIIVSMFIGAWSSTSRFSTVGGVRACLQMLSYEIPMTVVMTGPVIVAKSLSLSKIVQWQSSGFWFVTTQPLGFCILSICLLAALQRIPFDIPKAETELVAGWATEFSGKKLALLKLAEDFELVLAGAIMTSLYLGGPSGFWFMPPFAWFMAKLTLCILILSNLRALFARFRIDQLIRGLWQYLIPLALFQIILVQLIPW